MVGVLGGCSLANLEIYSNLSQVVLLPGEIDRRPAVERNLYGSPVIRWYRHLNSSLELFKEHYIRHMALSGDFVAHHKWLRQWERDAREEGIYAIETKPRPLIII